MTLFQLLLSVLLRLQSVLSGLQSIIMPRGMRGLVSTEQPRFILGQGGLKGQRLYAAKADLTACEVISVHNAMVFLGRPVCFEQVKREFFRRGALTLWFFGFFGGNPYSVKRVLRSFGVACETVTADELSRDGAYIISFFNGKHLSLHTIFCTRTDGKWLGYNLRANDRRPMPFDPKKLEPQFIRGYKVFNAEF